MPALGGEPIDIALESVSPAVISRCHVASAVDGVDANVIGERAAAEGDDYHAGRRLDRMSDATAPTKDDNENDETNGADFGVGIAIGLSIGVAIGTASDNLALWLPMGVALGAALGAALNARE